MARVSLTPEQKLARAEAETARKAVIAAKKAASAEKRAADDAAKAERKADRDKKRADKEKANAERKAERDAKASAKASAELPMASTSTEDKTSTKTPVSLEEVLPKKVSECSIEELEAVLKAAKADRKAERTEAVAARKAEVARNKANRILKKNLKVWVKFQPKQLHKGVIKLKKRVERDSKAAAKAAAEQPMISA